MSTTQQRYDADAIDEQTLDADPPAFEDEATADPAYVAVCRTVWLASRLLEDIQADERQGVAPDGVITQGYVDRLAAAFQTGRRVLDHDDPLREDLAAADDELLEALGDDVAPVASHVGLTLVLPQFDAAEEVSR